MGLTKEEDAQEFYGKSSLDSDEARAEQDAENRRINEIVAGCALPPGFLFNQPKEASMEQQTPCTAPATPESCADELAREIGELRNMISTVRESMATKMDRFMVLASVEAVDTRPSHPDRPRPDYYASVLADIREAKNFARDCQHMIEIVEL